MYRRISWLVVSICLVLALGATTALGAAWPTDYKGTTINVIMEDVPPLRAIAAEVGKFEELTGIRVNIEFANYDGCYEKIGLDLGTRTGRYDVMYVDSAWLGKFGPMLRELETFIADKRFPDIKQDGFYEKEWNAYIYDGKQVGIPIDSTTEVLLYRKDIFDEYGLKVPTTWREYRETARWITENVEGVYGNGMMAKQHDSLSCDFLPVMWSMGGRIFENWDSGAVVFNSPETVEAFKFYKSLTESAPPGVTGWTWDESINAMAQGQIAMAILFHDIGVTFDDPSISKVVGKVDYAPLPGGPAGRYAVYGGSCLAIPRFLNQRRAEAAYTFIVWATSYDVQKAITIGGVKGGTPPRKDVIEDPEVQTLIHKPMGELRFFKPIPETFENYLGIRPQVSAWPEINAIIYTKLSEYLAGVKTAEEAVAEAHQLIEQAF